MARIGISPSSIDVYESVRGNWRSILPTSTFTEAVLNPSFPVTFVTSPRGPQYMFREDYFDPVVRIRRGRFYELANIGQPSAEWLFQPGSSSQIFLHIYEHCQNFPDALPMRLV